MRTQSVMCCGTATKQLLNTCTQTRTSLPSRLGSTSSLGSHESPSPYANLKAPPPKPSVAMPQPSMANTVHEPAKPKPLVPKRLKAPPPVVLPKPVFPPAMPPPVKSPSAPPMAAEPAQPSKKARGVDAPVSSQSTAAAPQLVMPKTAIKSPPHLPAKTETTHSQVLKRAKPLPMEDVRLQLSKQNLRWMHQRRTWFTLRPSPSHSHFQQASLVPCSHQSLFPKPPYHHLQWLQVEHRLDQSNLPI